MSSRQTYTHSGAAEVLTLELNMIHNYEIQREYYLVDVGQLEHGHRI